MNIASRLGEGTTVSVRLPLNCEAARPVPESQVVSHPEFERAATADVLIKKSA
jgi:hypothetical protein